VVKIVEKGRDMSLQGDEVPDVVLWLASNVR